ncbi:MAG: ISAs1 family transposase [Rhizobium sp.]|nr:ISAs1 family transposase [Rhizobium sp.]
MSCLDGYFGSVPDPRGANASYRLGDLIVMMVAASLCGASCATEFSLFARERRQALSRLIDYDEAPSHDTFSRLLRLIDPEAFARAFAAFAEGFHRARDEIGDVVAIDGKALRRAYERGLAASPPLTVSAFATQARLCLAAASPEKVPGDNEIETAIRVVELLDLTDKIVTADALHCHGRMARAILDRGGDYMLTLKTNRRHWHLEACQQLDANPAETAESHSAGHGRAEWRQAEVVPADRPLMAGHKAFIRVTTRRNDEAVHTRLFMASTVPSAERALALSRAHWMVENALHWTLDVHLGEDESRARKDHAPANIALINRITRNILQSIDAPKIPISHRIKKCAWNDDYLITALSHMR